ncbi:MAG: hypothetical protein N2201_07350 [candidate division WOR-3 bacterium]|nr:hypothetical protein [candidate division WOR-3 bacterium]
MKKVLCVLFPLFMFNLISAQTQYTQDLYEKKTSFGIYAAEFAGALGGTICCGGTGCLLIGLAISSMFTIEETHPPGDPSMSIPILNTSTNSSIGPLLFAGLTALIIIPASSAAGTAQVGKRLNQEGKFSTSFGGAVIGSALGLGIGFGISRINPDKISWVMIPTALLGNCFGAVVGYNLS